MDDCCIDTYIKTLEEVKLMITTNTNVTIGGIINALEFAISLLKREEEKINEV